MNKLILSILCTLCGTFLLAQGLPEPQSPPRLVNDFAGIITQQQSADLEQKLVDFDRNTSTQIAVVTVMDLDGMSPSDFAQRLHDKWGVGRGEKNNGILMLVKPKTPDSKGEVFISVGYGLEGVIPDITAGRIIDTEMLPSFREGDYYSGIDKASNVLMQLSSGEFSADKYMDKSESASPPIIPFLVVALWIVLMIVLRNKRGNGGDNNSSGGNGGRYSVGKMRWPPIIMGGGRGFGGGSFGGGGFGGFGGGSSGGGGGGRSWIVLLVLSLSLSSCSKDEFEPEYSSRTVLIYIAADNNLSPFAERNLQDIIGGVKSSESNLLVYIDQQNKKPQLLKIGPNSSTMVVAEYDEENSADPAVLKRVVDDVMRRYPSDSYGAVLWSHGLGWLPPSILTVRSALGAEQSMWYKDPAAQVTKWFGNDGSSCMDITDIAAAFPKGRKFDFILFDACFMSSIEVLYDMRNVAKYIIASPTEVMGTGFPYGIITPMMFEKELRLADICSGFVSYYQKQSYPSASVALINTVELDALAAVSADLIKGNESVSVNPSNIQHLERLSTHIFYDMNDYYKSLSGSNPALYNTFKTQLSRVVVYSQTTDNIYSAYSGGGFFPINTFCGISAYIPHDGVPYNTAYRNTAWAKRVGGLISTAQSLIKSCITTEQIGQRLRVTHLCI